MSGAASAYERFGKRLFDIGAVALMLPLALPLLAMTILAVWAVLGRPVFFSSRRIGSGGAAFTMLKLRSMALGSAPEVERLSPFGRWLRAGALDELPQLLHVLQGRMSLVGPRPLPDRYRPVLPPARHRHRPGLTGLAQVSGRNALPWPRRLELDLAYVARPTLAGDLAILARTLTQLASARGAGLGEAPPGV